MHWTRSIAEAWEYVVAFINAGYLPTAAYDIYTATGGEIRSSLWFEAWHEAEKLAPNSEFVLLMPEEWTVPQGRFTDVAWDTRQEYLIQARTSYFDKNQRRWVADWRSIEFDRAPTKAEMIDVIQSTLLADYTEREVEGWALLDLNLYHSTGPVLD
jgi:hypothetical protein